MIRGEIHQTVSTPGDLFFHIRSDRRDVCFEVERQLVGKLKNVTLVIDETVGFRYQDERDLLGFVDGTANPTGSEATRATVVDDNDAASAGGSYAVVQKYLHDLDKWEALPVKTQEQIVGRSKVANVEFDDAGSGQKSHKTLNTIIDDQGQEHDILRDNMPFGSPKSGEFGTYFIGYSANVWVIERMLERMFLGDPKGLYDRILDFSMPLTGTIFFIPAVEFLSHLDDR